MEIKCVVAADNADGDHDIFPIVVVCTQAQYEEGKHYDAAEDEAEAHGYEPRYVFDEHDPGFRFFLNAIDWHGVETIVGL
jgi:hypothetical protein